MIEDLNSIKKNNASLQRKMEYPGSNFIIKDLPSLLIMILADLMLNDLLCCSNKYN